MKSISKYPYSTTESPNIGRFIMFSKQSKLDFELEYQRQKVWNQKQKNGFIESVLKDIPTPNIFLRDVKRGKRKNVYEIIDGKQRLNTIIEFFHGNTGYQDDENRVIWYFNDYKMRGEGKLPLSKFNIRIDGKNYPYTEKKLTDDDIAQFKGYQIETRFINQWTEDQAADLFIRLQSGSPLTGNEKLWATLFKERENGAEKKEIVEFVRTILAKKKYQLFNEKDDRYVYRILLIKLLFLEDDRIKKIEKGRSVNIQSSDTKFRNIKSFLEQDHSKKNARKLLQSNLNYVSRCFKGEQQLFTEIFANRTDLVSFYLTISFLRKYYSLNGKETKLGRTFKEFIDKRKGGPESDEKIKRYNLLVSSSTDDGSRIAERIKILIDWYTRSGIDFKELDSERFFTKEQKDRIYYKAKGRCQNKKCPIKRKLLKKESQYHHNIKYVVGGKTDIGNGLLLCKRCHNKIHSNKSREVKL